MQDIRIDNTTNNPIIVNGDFDVEESTVTDARLVLASSPNDWKEDPIIGPGFVGMINGDETPQELIGYDKLIRQQLEYVGISVQSINVNVIPFDVKVNG